MDKVVIAGAGLVGSYWALVLAQKGYRVTLVEKRSDMRKDELDSGRSINLVATSRGLHAFKKAGILEKVKEITVPVTGRMMHSKDGELTYQPYGRNKSECNLSVSRSLLNKLLIDEAEAQGVNIIFNHELSSLNIEKSMAQFIEGDNKSPLEVEFDRFFGADGAGSITRRELLRLIPSASESIDFIESDYKELFMPAKSDGSYALEREALHIWPRGKHMLMALPNLDGSFTITLYLPKTGEESFEKITDKETLKNFFKNNYKDSIELMPNFLKEYFENPQGLLGTVRMSHWIYQDKVALIGDAAHAIVPFFGQGMNCGLEDCTLLLELMEKRSNFNDIFNEYQSIQKPNGDAIADMALENFIEMQSKVADPKFLLKKQIENIIEKEFPEIYRSRYGMVTFTLIPYSEALRAGKKQKELLDELAKNINSIDELDLNIVEKCLKDVYSNQFMGLV